MISTSHRHSFDWLLATGQIFDKNFLCNLLAIAGLNLVLYFDALSNCGAANHIVETLDRID